LFDKNFFILIIPLIGIRVIIIDRGKGDLPMGFSTKELLEKVAVSEATLRRWISEGNRIPELKGAKKDWRGWHIWEEKHVEAIINYKKNKMNNG
jgi:hypothetical protein